MNYLGVEAIFRFEMRRFFKTINQSLLAPAIATSLYFIVFGAAIGSKISDIDGVSYAAFIVPGLTMLTVMNQSVSNASFGFYLPRFVGTIYEILSAPISAFEIILGYVGAAALKSLIICAVTLITARLFVNYSIEHPFWMVVFLVLTTVNFSLLGFIIAIWADGFEKLQFLPLMVITPLTFLGGTFYSIHQLPPFWQKVSMANPVFYIISGFRWSFFGHSEIHLVPCVLVSLFFTCVSLTLITFCFRTGYRIRS